MEGEEMRSGDGYLVVLAMVLGGRVSEWLPLRWRPETSNFGWLILIGGGAGSLATLVVK